MNTDTLKHLRGLLERRAWLVWLYDNIGLPDAGSAMMISNHLSGLIVERIVALHNAAPALLACAEALQAGHDMVESSVAHVSHGGPTREDAENWLKQAQAALDQLKEIKP